LNGVFNIGSRIMLCKVHDELGYFIENRVISILARESGDKHGKYVAQVAEVHEPGVEDREIVSQVSNEQ
jgi:hypothetical protein